MLPNLENINFSLDCYDQIDFSLSDLLTKKINDKLDIIVTNYFICKEKKINKEINKKISEKIDEIVDQTIKNKMNNIIQEKLIMKEKEIKNKFDELYNNKINDHLKNVELKLDNEFKKFNLFLRNHEKQTTLSIINGYKNKKFEWEKITSCYEEEHYIDSIHTAEGIVNNLNNKIEIFEGIFHKKLLKNKKNLKLIKNEIKKQEINNYGLIYNLNDEQLILMENENITNVIGKRVFEKIDTELIHDVLIKKDKNGGFCNNTKNNSYNEEEFNKKTKLYKTINNNSKQKLNKITNSFFDKKIGTDNELKELYLKVNKDKNVDKYETIKKILDKIIKRNTIDKQHIINIVKENGFKKVNDIINYYIMINYLENILMKHDFKNDDDKIKDYTIYFDNNTDEI